MRWSDRIAVAAVLSLAVVASGCSASRPQLPGAEAAAPPPAAPSFKDRIEGFFTGSSARGPQQVANADPNVACPYIDIRQGASTLTISAPGGNTAMYLRYQGTFVRAARECAVLDGQMVMRVGIEGRIVLGPAGGPGQINVPLRIAVVNDKPSGAKTIVTKLIRIPVMVASASDNPTFTHIEEGLSFPLPPPAELDTYIVYIGFDPIAAEAQDKQTEPPKRHRPKPKLKPTASTG